MELEVTLADPGREIDGADKESKGSCERMRDEEMAIGNDLEPVGVVHRIVGVEEHFRSNEDEERRETEGDPKNGFESGTGGFVHRQGDCRHDSLLDH